MGDRDEFDEFVASRYTRLCRTAYLLCGDWGHAEDIVQTTLVKVYRATGRRRVDDLDAYTHRALTNSALSWRRRRRHGEVPTEAPPDAVGDQPYDRVDLRSALLAALGRLPAEQRAVLVLRFFEDLGEDATARILGCSVGTVKSRTSRALATLRRTGFPLGSSVDSSLDRAQPDVTGGAPVAEHGGAR